MKPDMQALYTDFIEKLRLQDECNKPESTQLTLEASISGFRRRMNTIEKNPSSWSYNEALSAALLQIIKKDNKLINEKITEFIGADEFNLALYNAWDTNTQTLDEEVFLDWLSKK